MSEPHPLMILLSGMNADARLFAPQFETFSNLIVPSWIPPRPCESLRAYAARFARVIDPGRPCIVGGASFGGIVAHEMAPFLQTDVCLLIGSVRSPEELPWWWRAFRPLSFLSEEAMCNVVQWFGTCCQPMLSRRMRRQIKKWSSPQSTFLRWACRAVLDWRLSPAAQRITTRQIHGEADRTLPIRRMNPDVVVPRGGHLLPLTHSTWVNEFLRQSS